MGHTGIYTFWSRQISHIREEGGVAVWRKLKLLLQLLYRTSRQGFVSLLVIIKNRKHLLVIIKNIKYMSLFFYVLRNKVNVFLVGNGAIGHYPVNLFLSKLLYGDNCIYAYKSGVEFANEYLNEKVKQVLKFDPRYEKVIDIMKAVSILSSGIYRFNEFPEQMQMTTSINFAEAFDGRSKLFEFSDDENSVGLEYLSQYDINPDKFVCLLVRNDEYYRSIGITGHLLDRMSYRNPDPKSYNLAVEYLLDLEYHVIRMGKGFTERFPISHPKFIDYAVSEDRDDFLDIWLVANCCYCFGSSCGLVCLPVIFNNPFLAIDVFPQGRMQSWAAKSIFIPSVARKNGELLSLRDMVELNIIGIVDRKYYKKIGVEIIHNDAEDILEAVKDMENKIQNGFYVNELNMLFWKNMRKEWHSGIKTGWSSGGRTFDYFHKINGIKTTIPDFYLKKYHNAFFDYK